MTDHISLIARYEGFSAEPFWDYHQWSVGHGSYAGSRSRSQRPSGINGFTYPISESQARSLLQQTIGSYERTVDKYNSKYNWTANERAALISFAYNIGSIDGLTNNGTRSKEEIASKMLQYNKAGSRVVDGLTRRRQDEYALFTGGAAPDVPPGDNDTVGIGTTGAEGAGSTGAADTTSDFAAANNTTDLWEIAERSGNFWDNELDTFDYYTYQLELFCVDELTTIGFLADDYDLNSIANDSWPDQSAKRITIAMTAGTTEFNIQDLQVESLGTGSQSGARMSGVATRLNFNIIQVGNTSLNDSLQNAAVLMGYTSIHDATWFIKVNFLGYESDSPKKIQATKVIPFKLSDFGDLQTSTDARGTSTVLNGTVMLQTAFDSSINVVDYQFRFKIKDTLGETLTSFFEELNLSIESKDVTGDKKFYNQYDFLTSPEFEEFNSSAMNGPNPNLSSASADVARRTSGLNIAAQEGLVAVGSNIYNIVADICNQSLKVREALTEQSDTFSNAVNLTPIAIPNPTGLNVITNTRGYSVTYHIYVRRTPLVQNGVDAVVKAQNSAKMIDEIFTQGRCRKRYYYQYTGLNDQILDFQVSLNKQLTKAYVAPTDQYAFSNFISGPNGQEYSLENLNQKAQTAIQKASTEADGLNEQLEAVTTQFDNLATQFENVQSEIQNDFMSQIQGIFPGDVSADDFFGDRDINETLALINDFSNDNGIDAGSILTADRLQGIQGQIDRIQTAREAVSGLGGQLSRNQSEQDDIMMQAMGAKISDDVSESLGRGQDNFDLIPESVRGNNNFVLIEALDTDVVTNLRSAEFSALIHTLINSPTVFRRTIIPKLLDVDRTTVFRSSDQEDIEIARQRYYEGLNVDISMQQLSITIKGDPFWLNNYIPPDKASEIFGVNGTTEQFKTDSANYSGFQYAMIINNKAAGTDELMNTKIANLMVDVYLVKSITSSFSGGLFTQTLNMIKKNFPSDFRQLNPTIDVEAIDSEPVVGDDSVGDGINPGSPGDDLGGLDGEGILGGGRGDNPSLFGDPFGGGLVNSISGSGRGGDPRLIANNAYTAISGSLSTLAQKIAESPFPSSGDSARYTSLLNQATMASLHGSSEAKAGIESANRAIADSYGDPGEVSSVLQELVDSGENISPEAIAMLKTVYGDPDAIEAPTQISDEAVTNVMTEIQTLSDQNFHSASEIAEDTASHMTTSIDPTVVYDSPPSLMTIENSNMMLDGTMPLLSTETYANPEAPLLDYDATQLDALDLPEEVVSGYKDAASTRNGIKVRNYIDSLPANQADALNSIDSPYIQKTQPAIEVAPTISKIQSTPLKTPREVIMQSRIEDAQTQMIAEAGGSYNDLTDDEKRHYENLSDAYDEIDEIAKLDPIRNEAKLKIVNDELDKSIRIYNDRLAGGDSEWSWTRKEADAKEQLEIQNDATVLENISNLDDGYSTPIADRVIVDGDGSVNIMKDMSTLPTKPSDGFVLPIDYLSENNDLEITDQHLAQYELAENNWKDFRKGEFVTVNIVDPNPEIGTFQVEMLSSFENPELAQQYGINTTPLVEGETISLDDPRFRQWNAGNLDKIRNQITSDLPLITTVQIINDSEVTGTEKFEVEIGLNDFVIVEGEE